MNKIPRTFFLICTCFYAGVLNAGKLESTETLSQGYVVHKGLLYSQKNGDLTMDLYLPHPLEGSVPCVLVIQGGGFLSQDGKKFRPFAEHLARNGFAAALISYNGRPDHTYMTTIANTKAAVRFVRDISKQHGIDPDRIGAMGRSAGATLAVMLAVTGGAEEFEGEIGQQDCSSQIQAAVGISGVYDFIARFTDREQLSMQPNFETKIQTNGDWIGTPWLVTDKEWINASAINHIDPRDPPVLFIHSRNDKTVPWLQSRNMHAAMKQNGIESELVTSETGGHAGPDNAMELMVGFFRKTLANAEH